MIDARTGQYLRMMTAKAANACVVQRLVGVNQSNADGSSRQKYVRRCNPLDRLKLVSAPKPSDAQAVGVADAKGHLLGYLDRRCALETMNAAKNGVRLEVVVAARWQDPNGEYCLVVAIFHLKPEFQSLKQAEVVEPAAQPAAMGGSVVQRWNLGMLMAALVAREENNAGQALTMSQP